jgi:DNA-binding transcriptional ArsR family regulator
LKQISEPTRLQILLALADGKKSTNQLCRQVGQNGPDLGYHLASLIASKVVDSHWEGIGACYELTEPGARFVDSIRVLLDQPGAPSRPLLSKSEWKKLVKKAGSGVDDPEDWLITPNPRFEGRRPIDLIGTDDEVRVHIIIEALVQGCFS